MAMNETLTRLGYLKFKRMYDSLSEEERELYTQLLTKPPLSEEEQMNKVMETIKLIEEMKHNAETT